MNRQRHPWDPVILTTLPHILCALSAPYPYSTIIALSTIASIAWHAEHEPMSILFWIDYSFAFLWGYYDIAHLGAHGYLLNIIAIATNIYSSREPYARNHALWHLFSCILTVYKVDLMWRVQKGEGLPTLVADSTTRSL